MTAHYDVQYFGYQAPIGEFGGWANASKFEAFVKPDYTVVDFGCGGGYLLKNLKCVSRIGVEINPEARAAARGNGVEVFGATSSLQDNSCDLVISNHALEHTERPLDELRDLLRVLKPGGQIVMVVPSESVHHTYKADDPNHHLYTWSPMNLGHLLSEAGFTGVSSKAVFHRWPPKVYKHIARISGRKGFDFIASIYGRLSLAQAQSIGVGKKPS